MPDFWIDSNIYLRSRDGILAFDIAPQFWNDLTQFAIAGRISSPVEVYDELIDHSIEGDEFDTWLKGQRPCLFVGATDEVRRHFEAVSAYVTNRYIEANSSYFLRKADPWLIAHALASGGSIVTNETLTQEPGPNRNTGLIDTRVKIPSVANHFGVETVSLATMLRALGVNDL